MPSVSFQFRAEGIDSVISGIRKIKSESANTAKAVTSNAASAAKAQAREADKAAKAEIRAAQQAAREKTRIAQKQLREQEKLHKKQEQQRKQAAKSDSRFISGVMGGAAGATVAAIGAAIGAVASVVSPAVGQVIDLEERARRLAISSRQPGQGFEDPTGLANQFLKQGAQFGLDPNEIAAGGDAFVSLTGDLKTFRKNLDILSNTTLATGARFEDVSAVAANLQNQFGIVDRAGLERSIASMVASGRSGSFEFRDAAGLMGRILSAGAAYGLRGQAGLGQLLSLTQVARGSIGTPDMATTAVERVLTNLTAKEHKSTLAGHGIKVDKSDLVGTLVNTILKTTQAERQKIFLDEGIRAINPLSTAADEAAKKTIAETKAKGKVATAAEIEAAKREAIIAMLEKQSGAAGDWNEILKDSAFAQESTSTQLQKAWSSLMLSLQGPALAGLKVFGSMLTGTNSIIPALAMGFASLVGITKAVVSAFAAVTRFIGSVIPGMGGLTTAVDSFQAMLSDQNALQDNQNKIDEATRIKQGMSEQVDKVVAKSKKPVTAEGRAAIEAALFGNKTGFINDRLTALGAERKGLEDNAYVHQKTFENSLNDQSNAAEEWMKKGSWQALIPIVGPLFAGMEATNPGSSPVTQVVDLLSGPSKSLDGSANKFNAASDKLSSAADALAKSSVRTGPTPQP